MTTRHPSGGPRELVELTGHVLDTGLFTRVLDDVRALGADYEVVRFDVGKEHDDPSTVRIAVTAPDAATLDSVVMRLHTHGANLVEVEPARLTTVERDGVFPADFYATTNLPTQVRVAGTWHPVENPEMDCGIVVELEGELEGEGDAAVVRSVRTVPVSDVRAGSRIVSGAAGVRVTPPPREAGDDSGFTFMQSEVSSEKPQALVVRQIAEEMRAVKERGQRILWVLGPAVVHTGAAPSVAALVRGGWVDVLFGGNAIATHDVEQAIYGTSLGVDLSAGRGVEHGHEHHLRAINAVRQAGSLAAAVEQGVLTSGIMHALVEGGKDFVLVGSVRDDGPLPDVRTDVLDGQRAMRAQLHSPDKGEVGFCIVVATMLHGVATGNVLPSHIPLVCVDINPATVTKLADRGSAQARGVVTDVGLFCATLARELTGSET
ncbi:TIGR00300 family protein [Aquipuribacter nitratireducens]|uniref:ornithine cyclodeaminase n=1 Tax=Aquipuribacter nitratireducens TaxID=650104 RepID=A0ABW0GTM0_9MICO